MNLQYILILLRIRVLIKSKFHQKLDFSQLSVAIINGDH